MMMAVMMTPGGHSGHDDGYHDGGCHDDDDQSPHLALQSPPAIMFFLTAVTKSSQVTRLARAPW